MTLQINGVISAEKYRSEINVNFHNGFRYIDGLNTDLSVILLNLSDFG